MNINTWKNYYFKIISDFGFDENKDLESAKILKDLILKYKNNIDISKLKEIINNKVVYIFGAGPSLKRHINQYKSMENKTDSLICAADGSTKALMEENIIPDIIVSDLDGDMEYIIKSNSIGSIVVVHAHGDNIDKLKKYVPKLKNIIGSYQYPIKIDNLINYGGFTDGDRCCFLCERFNPKKMVLCGMDFGVYITKYSRPNIKNDVEVGDEIKIKKLKYGKELVDYLIKNSNVRIEYME